MYNTRALAKIQVIGTFHIRGIRRNEFTQIYRDLFGDAMLLPSFATKA